MIKRLIFLLLLAPFVAQAQFTPGANVNGSIQRNSISGWMRYLQGTTEDRLALYSDIPTGTNFIQNQNASAQTGNLWINGFGIFGATNPATVGNIRLPNTTSIVWRNGTNSGNLAMGFNSSDVLQIGGIGISVGSITSTGVSANALVKANGSNTFVDATPNTDYLPVSNAAMTGAPTAPTATGGTNTTQLATTAFVQSAVSGVTGPWTKTSAKLTPATANDNVEVTSNQSSSIYGNNSATSGVGLLGNSTGLSGVGVLGQAVNGYGAKLLNNSTTLPSLYTDQAGSGPLSEFRQGTNIKSTIINNGGFNWAGATPTTTAGWDASKNLVPITNTGTGNAVRATSPTLVTPSFTGNTFNYANGTNNAYSISNIGNGISEGWQVGKADNSSSLAPSNSYYWYNLTGGALRMSLTPAGVVTINALGSGAVNATAGVLSVVSDSRLKNVHGKFKGSAIFALLKVQAGMYWNWKESSGMPADVQKFSVLADKVYGVLGEEFAPTQKDGYHGLDDRAVLSIVIQAIQEISNVIFILIGSVLLLIAWIIRLEVRSRKMNKKINELINK